jgi:hypothetical protein
MYLKGDASLEHAKNPYGPVIARQLAVLGGDIFLLDRLGGMA